MIAELTMPARLILCAVSLWLLSTPAAGQSVCARCHREQAHTHGDTSMAHALTPADRSEVLKANPKLTFKQGPFSYSVVRDGDRTMYSVTDGKQTISAPIAWAFGLGAAGQTYVFEKGGAWYESRVSFYKELSGLDLTIGARGIVPKDLEEAAGRRMSAKDSVECFGCHSTGGVREGKLSLADVVPGVQCANCHTGAIEHAAAAGAGKGAAAAMPKLSKLSTEETSDFCGRCHRTWADIAANGPRGVENIRFQPYRLTNSKCYDAMDRRIGCTSCHDPHQTVERSAAVYDRKCLTCHSNGSHSAAAGKMCRQGAKAECVTCHMPKIELPGSHNQFTDHQIRIVRNHDPYPN